MLNLRRGLLVRSTTRHVLYSTASVTNGENHQFNSLALDQERLLPVHQVTRRVLEYLEVDPNEIQRALSSKKVRSLPHKALFAPQHVRNITPLARWGFQQLENDSVVADAVFEALRPHANMARGAVWQQYFLRQFFFSNAPLRAYLRVYKTHLDAHAASKQDVAAEDQEMDSDAKGGEEEIEASEGTHSAIDKLAATSKKKEYSKMNPAVTVLAESKEWEWVPQHLASTIIKEFCLRGRFAEAIESYTLLPLLDAARRDVVTLLQEYEQYLSVLYLYEVHRTMGTGFVPLGVAPEFDALKKVGRVKEMEMRFQQLPVEEQRREDIQKVIGN